MPRQPLSHAGNAINSCRMSETDLPALLLALPLYSKTCWGMLHSQFLRDAAVTEPAARHHPSGWKTPRPGHHWPGGHSSLGTALSWESPQRHLWDQQWPQLRLLFQVFQRKWQLKSPFVHCWASVSCSLESFNSPGLWTKKEKLERGWGQKMVLTHKCGSCHGHFFDEQARSFEISYP